MTGTDESGSAFVDCYIRLHGLDPWFLQVLQGGGACATWLDRINTHASNAACKTHSGLVFFGGGWLRGTAAYVADLLAKLRQSWLQHRKSLVLLI
jgi:hypothetical protein